MLHCLREDGCHWAIYIHAIQLLLRSHLFLKHEMLRSALTSMEQMQQYFSAIVSKGLAQGPFTTATVSNEGRTPSPPRYRSTALTNGHRALHENRNKPRELVGSFLRPGIHGCSLKVEIGGRMHEVPLF